MKTTFKRHPILVTLTTLLGVYHLYHLPKTRFGWQNGRPVVLRSSVKYTDAATESLAGLGTWLRFKSGQDSEMVFRGKPGSYQRLYLRTDLLFQSPESLPPAFPETVANYRRYIRSLQEKGIALVIVPIPTKTAVDRQSLETLPSANIWLHGSTPAGEAPARVYENFLIPPATIDLLRAFTESDGDPYVPWDYHWTSKGIAQAAQEVAARLTGITPELHLMGLSHTQHRDRLLTFYRLPSWFLDGDPIFGWQEPLFRISRVAKGPSECPLFLAGTSYSRRLENTPYSLASQLGDSLQRPVESFLEDGGRLDLGLQKLHAAHPTLPPCSTVVWEFPIDGARLPLGDLPAFSLANGAGIAKRP